MNAAAILFIIMIPSFLHGMMRDGIANWVPTMITETYGVSPSFSADKAVMNAAAIHMITTAFQPAFCDTAPKPYDDTAHPI